MRRSRVLFPQPLGPMRTMLRPRATDSVIGARTETLPNDFETSRSSRMVAPLGNGQGSEFVKNLLRSGSRAASSARQAGPFPGPGFPAVLGILMYFNIHSGCSSPWPAERDLPSLATVFYKLSVEQRGKQRSVAFDDGPLPAHEREDLEHGLAGRIVSIGPVAPHHLQ